MEGNASDILLAELRARAKEIREDVLIMLHQAGSGHIGGSLSAVEIVVALFFAKMRHDPKDPCWDDRDRFVLSKGHAAPLLYAALARTMEGKGVSIFEGQVKYHGVAPTDQELALALKELGLGG